jgi:UDP-glucose 4-epimerase
MRVVVLGATGFLGSNLTSELLRRNMEVIAFSPSSDRSRILKSRGVEVIEGDFLKPETLDFPLEEVDWLVHLASTTSPRDSVLEPRRDAANLTASSVVFQRAIDAGVKKILFSSSGGTVYGDTGDRPVKETAGTRPVIPYTKTKLAIEDELMDLCDGTRTTPVVLRFGNPYGPNQYPEKGTGVITAWLRSMRDSKPIVLYGSGDNARDFFYVSDAVSAMTLSLQSDRARGIYNIGSGTATTLTDVISTIEEVTGKKAPVLKVMERPSDAVKVIALDSGKARADFGWERRVSLREGIALTWNWVLGGEKFTID